jgi:HSP20 family protein
VRRTGGPPTRKNPLPSALDELPIRLTFRGGNGVVSRRAHEEVTTMAFQLSAFDPMRALLELQRELDRVFEKPLGFDLGPSGGGVFPPINVFRNRDTYVMKLEVPGLAQDQIQIEAAGQTLTISGQRQPATPANGSFHRRERSRGEFSRSVQLPADLDLSRTEASLKNGVLTLSIPKREEAKPRQISVRAA